MKKLLNIITMRKLPGVIIVDTSGAPLFMNEEVTKVVPIIKNKYDSGSTALPESIRKVCLQNETLVGNNPNTSAEIIYCPEGVPYSLRSIPLSRTVDGTKADHFMLLVEPIAERRQVNFATVQTEYGLSRREIEVLKLICHGLSNREIAERLFISEHTAKDHVRRILKAFNACSRSEVISHLSA